MLAKRYALSPEEGGVQWSAIRAAVREWERHAEDPTMIEPPRDWGFSGLGRRPKMTSVKFNKKVDQEKGARPATLGDKEFKEVLEQESGQPVSMSTAPM